MRVLWRSLLLAAFVSAAAWLFAQATTGTITGIVTSDGKALPGVSITISSPSLQGVRTATSGEAGGYSFPNVPPGDYTATFELSGMQTVRKRVIVLTTPPVNRPNSADTPPVRTVVRRIRPRHDQSLRTLASGAVHG